MSDLLLPLAEVAWDTLQHEVATFLEQCCDVDREPLGAVGGTEPHPLVPPREVHWDSIVAHCQMVDHCVCGKGNQTGHLDQNELLLEEGEDSIHLLVAKTFAAAVVHMVVEDWKEQVSRLALLHQFSLDRCSTRGAGAFQTVSSLQLVMGAVADEDPPLKEGK